MRIFKSAPGFVQPINRVAGVVLPFAMKADICCLRRYSVGVRQFKHGVEDGCSGADHAPGQCLPVEDHRWSKSAEQ